MKKGMVLATILGIATGFIGGALVINNIREKDIGKWKDMSDKHLSLFMLMNKWMKVKQERGSIKTYFENNGYTTVAIYGMSYVGERLLDELTEYGINVKYAIDQNAKTIYSDIDMFTPDDTLPEVDVVVVSAVYYYEEICKKLAGKVNCPIVSLDDVVREV